MIVQELKREAWQSAERIKEGWRAGRSPDAAAALRDEPGLDQHRSVVIDLAYEEYLQRERGGCPPDPSIFARGFPDFQASVRDLIDAHRHLMNEPERLHVPEADWPEAGEMLEGLVIRRVLGKGSFGRAYLAFDPAIGRLRVVKVAPGGTAEARVIGGLDHPHVVDVLWTRPVGDRTAVCMPFVGSATLERLIKDAKGRTPSAKRILKTTAASPEEPPASRAEPLVYEGDSDAVAAAAVGAKLARAIAYLHSRGVVHGDVKPSNAVLQPGGSPQVIDFNLAAGEASPLAVGGTLAYMAPELLDAMLDNVRLKYDGEKADVFALGVTLVELFGGRHPYRRKGDNNIASLAVAMRKCKLAIPGLSPAVMSVLNRALAIEPAARPTAAELANELDRFVRRERTHHVRRTRSILLSLAAILVVGLSLGAALRSGASTTERAPETAAEFHIRGLALLHNGKPDAARADFISAHERGADPKDLALAAYCHSLTGENKTARDWGKKAIDAGGDTAEVRNNRGSALAKLGSLEEAVKEFDAALAHANDFRPAQYNRAMARYVLGLNPKKVALLPLAIADIEDVLKIGPYSAELHADAARIYAYASIDNPGYLDSALEQLKLAAKLGHPPARLKNDAVFKKQLGADPRFVELLNAEPQPAMPPLQLHFIEPFN